MSTNIIKEIKDESRKDAIAQFFKKHKILLTRLAIILAITLVAYFVYSIINGNLEDKYSKFLHQSLIEEELGNFNKAEKNLEKILNARFAPKNIKALAGLRYSGFLLRDNKIKQALENYEKIAFTSSNDDFIQELAGLLATKIIVNETSLKNNQIEQSKAISRITRIIQNNKTLKAQAMEQLAILYINLRKNDDARKILEKITKTKNAPKTLLSRTKDMINLTSS